MTEVSETLGDRLSRAMKAKGVSNGEVAKATGVHVGTVTGWRGNRFPPTDEKLDAIAELLGVTSSWIRYGDGPHASRRIREASPSYDARPAPISQIVFASPTSQQRAKVWLEQFLLELAEEGATQDFVDSSRRVLLNTQNYEFDVGAAAGHRDSMDDDEKLQHMQALAVGIRAALKVRQKKEKRKQ
jgi:transcriptional regulator with XRE-family HTH domain